MKNVIKWFKSLFKKPEISKILLDEKPVENVVVEEKPKSTNDTKSDVEKVKKPRAKKPPVKKD